jgi:hypothetical protein
VVVHDDYRLGFYITDGHAWKGQPREVMLPSMIVAHEAGIPKFSSRHANASVLRLRNLDRPGYVVYDNFLESEAHAQRI